jgi:hypothetical protein
MPVGAGFQVRARIVLAYVVVEQLDFLSGLATSSGGEGVTLPL